MKTFSELRERAKEMYNILEAATEQDANGKYRHLEYERMTELLEDKLTDFPAIFNGTNFVIEGPLQGSEYGQLNYSLEHNKKFLEVIEPNKHQVILWYAILRTISMTDEAQSRYGVNVNANIMFARLSSTYQDEDNKESSTMTLLRLFSEAKPDTESFKIGISRYNETIVDTKRSITRYGQDERQDGLTSLLTGGPNFGYSETFKLEEQITELQKQLPSNGLVSRTWGFEIESPDCKGVKPLPDSGIDKGDDGSLRSYEGSDDCECDCRDCTYHECNCDWCDSYNDDPEHCGANNCATAESAEFRSTGGIQRVKHNGMYKLCQDLIEAEAEANDSAGTHIHVWAQDLTTHEVGQVMGIYKRLEGLMAVIAGRSDVSYARKIAVEHIRGAIKKTSPTLTADKPRAVNVSQLLTSRGTIEFRQMDCNYNADRITLFAWMVRGFVEVAKRGARIDSFVNVNDFYDLVNVFGKFNYFIGNESPSIMVPGSKLDMTAIKKVTHRVA